MKLKFLALTAIIAVSLASCKKDEIEVDNGPYLVFKLKLDPDQERLDNFGNPSQIPAGHAAQTPDFNYMSTHHIELAPNAFTPLGYGEIVYLAKETEQGGSKAVLFDDLKQVKDGEVIYKIPIKDVNPGSYDWARVSVAYQNYDIDFSVTVNGTDFDWNATVASFVGHNNYIGTYKIKDKTVPVNGNRLQGYWGIEIPPIGGYYPGEVVEGQAPATTVPNPNHAGSPIPAGSCTLTGQFPQKLIIKGDETKDVIVELAFSINNSFEWEDLNGDGKYQPDEGEMVVDMGVRGLIPTVIN